MLQELNNSGTQLREMRTSLYTVQPHKMRTLQYTVEPLYSNPLK